MSSTSHKTSRWTGWRDGLDGETYFRTVLTEHDARAMSRRQLEDFYRGCALIAAAFEPDERFEGVAETMAERIASVRFDERLRDFIDRLDRT
jgi:hypothetical protein